MSALASTSNQSVAGLLQEAVALDHELIETTEMSRLRPGSLELVSRCNVLLGLMARGGKASSMESLGRTATIRALSCAAAVRLAMLETDAGAVSRWVALLCYQCTEFLTEAAASSPGHPGQRALNEIAQCLAIATLVVDAADGVRLRELLQRSLDQFNANAAVLTAENEIAVDAFNDAVVLEALARDLPLASDRAACLDKAISGCRIAVEHFGRVDNSEFCAKAESLLGKLTYQREGLTGDAKPKAPAVTVARAAKPAMAAPLTPRFCGACGAGVQPGWKFCKACGAPLKPGASSGDSR